VKVIILVGGLGTGDVQSHNLDETDCKTTLVDTGLESKTGGCVKRL
jgi:hypothetical protein